MIKTLVVPNEIPFYVAKLKTFPDLIDIEGQPVQTITYMDRNDDFASEVIIFAYFLPGYQIGAVYLSLVEKHKIHIKSRLSNLWLFLLSVGLISLFLLFNVVINYGFQSFYRSSIAIFCLSLISLVGIIGGIFILHRQKYFIQRLIEKVKGFLLD